MSAENFKSSNFSYLNYKKSKNIDNVHDIPLIFLNYLHCVKTLHIEMFKDIYKNTTPILFICV